MKCSETQAKGEQKVLSDPSKPQTLGFTHTCVFLVSQICNNPMSLHSPAQNHSVAVMLTPATRPGECRVPPVQHPRHGSRGGQLCTGAWQLSRCTRSHLHLQIFPGQAAERCWVQPDFTYKAPTGYVLVRGAGWGELGTAEQTGCW